ncbi:MAG: 23S rRNA (uracil(1939)-C(5))-methyltransferase RlmD [Proteobacteria bacterium]|nr:23S rRNA (uracil(1939)-C(5))-methyltransferase RlmD [Pseudomonadota bacterium]
MARQRRRKLIEQPFEVLIDDLSHDGRGIARINGKVIFVSGALPAERVMVQHTGGNKNYEEGVVTEVLSASDDRVAARCKFYAICNGCTMMHLSAQKQIEFKQNTLKQNLIKMAKTQPDEWLPALTDSAWHYRRRARLSVRWVIAKDKVLVGFREKNGRYVAAMDYCEILQKPLDGLLQPLAEMIASLRIKQHIAQIEAAIADNDIALIIRHLKPIRVQDEEIILAFAKQHNVRIYSQSKGPKTIIAINKKIEPLYFDMPNNIRMEFLPSDFIQVNAGMNKKMIALAMTLLDLQADDVVLDLFCGLGNFTLPFSQKVNSIVGIEGEKTLVERAKSNAKSNNLQNITFAVADLRRNHENSDWFQQDYTKVLIDPPRSGAWEVLPLIAQTKANTLLYVSCHPASLARDTDRLVNELGFNLVTAGVMDMFPHTSHVESIALFVR